MFPSLLVQISLLLCYSAPTLATAPTVTLPYGTFQGFNDGNLTKFLGIQFAQAGRFEAPRSPGFLRGIQNATQFGPACPQQALSPLPDPVPFSAGVYPSVSEDCLSLDIYKPIASASATRLPVFVWIFGGGFEVGNSRDIDLTPAVERSIATGQPVMVVAINYRVNGFGFLAGKEVAEAGVTNLGLRDQIFGLEWIQQHIAAFGGDASRVVVGGVSAGSISTGLLFLDNKMNSNTLFRGAFMASGSPLPLPSVADGQSTYDQLVAANNCTSASDTLRCLRQVPFDSLMASINKTADVFSFKSIANVWFPRIDNDVVVHQPFDSVSRGLYSKAPLLSGDSDDEGTVFSVALLNITTGDEFLDYVHFNLLPKATPDQIAKIGRLYPDDPTKGSPFGTGTADQLSPEFKRLAAFQGDILLMAPRRFFLEHASTRQNTWSWLNKRGKTSSFLGAFHGSDLPSWFPANTTGDNTAVDAFVNFVNTLNPNHPSKSSTKSSHIVWPTWNTPSSTGPTSLLTLGDPSVVNITSENFRVAPIGYLTKLLLDEVASV